MVKSVNYKTTTRNFVIYTYEGGFLSSGMASIRRVLLAPRAFTCQPLGCEMNRGTLGQQFALRGADGTGFH